MLSCAGDRLLYTWNQSDTLQRWSWDDVEEAWVEAGIKAQSGYGPKNYKDARQEALTWHAES